MRACCFDCFDSDGRESRQRAAFTLLEVLAAVAILSVVMVLTFSIIGSISTVLRRSTDRIESFQQARLAFDVLTRNLSQATLNSYLDYDDANAPKRYQRKSELKFLCENAGQSGIPGTPESGQAVFFQAPVGLTKDHARYGDLEALLNTCGYYVEFASDQAYRPSFVRSNPVYRYRLMQLLVPTEANTVYSLSGNSWFSGYTDDVNSVADNVVAFIVRPQDPGSTLPDLTSDYTYNSYAAFSDNQPQTSHQLPPVVHLTMIAIDETSAKRMESGDAIPAAVSTVLAGKFEDPSQYESDLAAVEAAFNAAVPPVAYRIFSSAVPIRESKWTK